MLYVLTLGWVWFAAAGALGLLVGLRDGDAGTGRKILRLVGDPGGVRRAGRRLRRREAWAGSGPRRAAAGDRPVRRGWLILSACPLAAAPRAFYRPRRPRRSSRRRWSCGDARATRRPPLASLRTPPNPPPPNPPLPTSSRPSRRPPTARPPPRAESAAKASPAKKHFPGHPPESLAAPRGGTADDLTRIKGIGPKSVEKLHALGVFHFDQIAAWNIDNARWIGAALSVPGRVERGKWIQQARELVAAREPSR